VSLTRDFSFSIFHFPFFIAGGSRNLKISEPARRREAPRFWQPIALFCAFSITVFCNCGKVGAPVAPARLTERTSELTAIQRGAGILLTWPSPTLVQEQSSRFYIARVDIYRLTERRDQEPVLDPDDFEATAKLIGFMERTGIEDQVKTLGHLQFTDAVNLVNSRELANTRLRYAIRYVNKRGQSALFSNTVAIDPAPGIAMPPTDLTVANQDQDLIALSWNPPAANVDGTAPTSVVGYNVYRRRAKRESGGELLNSEPVTGTSFTDTKFQYQVDYVYFVRALSQGANGLIESADSQPLALMPVDTFAPSAPEPVSIASANGVISLFWPSSPERDVIGYNVYRADSADTQEKDWIKLNDQPVTTVTFRDDRVVIDRTYFYRVTAVDGFNNESKPSRVISETAHP
jgi:hypothetical protein